MENVIRGLHARVAALEKKIERLEVLKESAEKYEPYRLFWLTIMEQIGIVSRERGVRSVTPVHRPVPPS
jgi:hypothetical protein